MANMQLLPPGGGSGHKDTIYFWLMKPKQILLLV